MGNEQTQFSELDFEKTSPREFHQICMHGLPFAKVSTIIYSTKLFLINDFALKYDQDTYTRNYYNSTYISNDKTKNIKITRFGIEFFDIYNRQFKIFKIDSLTIEDILKRNKRENTITYFSEKQYASIKDENKFFHIRKNLDEIWQNKKNLKMKKIKSFRPYDIRLIKDENEENLIVYIDGNANVVVNECIPLIISDFEIVVKTRESVIIFPYGEKVLIHDFFHPLKDFIPLGKKIKIHCKNGEFLFDKNFIKFLESEFLNNQLENENEIFIPLFNNDEINVENLIFLDYIGSGIMEKCKKYLSFLNL